MHFGITLGQAAPWHDVLEIWRFVDRETTFTSAWLFDHFVPGRSEEDSAGPCFEAWTMLAALAQATSRVRLGVLVSGVTYRNPGLLAKMASTVDHVSEGRLELGIGAAWHQGEHQMYGYDFPSVREREDRLEEAAKLIRRLFESDGPVSFDGKHYGLQGAVFDPKPVQSRVPIVIGGDGERRTLRTLARYGDVMDCGGTPARIRSKIQVLERHCRDAGRNPDEIIKGYRGPIVVTENQPYLDRLAEALAEEYQIPTDEVRSEMPIGSGQHVREVVARYAEVGIQRMVMLTQPPWKPDIYRRINDEVLAAFA